MLVGVTERLLALVPLLDIVGRDWLGGVTGLERKFTRPADCSNVGKKNHQPVNPRTIPSRREFSTNSVNGFKSMKYTNTLNIIQDTASIILYLSTGGSHQRVDLHWVAVLKLLDHVLVNAR